MPRKGYRRSSANALPSGKTADPVRSARIATPIAPISGARRPQDRFAAAAQAGHRKIEEGPQLRRRMPPTRVDQVNRQLVAFVRRQQPTQRSSRDLVGGLVAQHAGNAKAGAGRIDRRLCRAHDEPGLDGDARFAALVAEQPTFDWRNGGERDHHMGAEIRRNPRRSMSRQVVRGRDHDAAHGADAGRDRRAFRERADPHRDIEPLLHQIDRPVDLVEEGLDVAVRIGALAESSAVATRVGAVRRIVVASADYLARHGTPRAPADLGAHAVIAFSAISAVERWVFRDRGGEASVAVKPRLVVTTAEAAVDAACAGFGITRVLSYQAADEIARGSLRRLLPANEGDELPIHLIYPGGRHPPPKLRAFLDFAVPRLRRRCEAILRATSS